MSENGTKRRSFLTAVGGAAATTTLGGCLGILGGGGEGTTTSGGKDKVTTKKPKDLPQGGTLTFSRGAKSKTLDPQNTTSGEDVKAINQFYNTLIEWKPGTTKLTDGLAKDWSMSGKSVSLTLKEGIKFHNGEEFTADDFIATYRRFVDPEYKHYAGDKYTSAYGPFTFGKIEDVSKDGKYKLTITLKQKYAPFLRNLAMFAANVLSEKAIKNKGQDLKTKPVGTGPFKLKNWDQSGQKITMTKNKDFWGPGPALDEVVFTVISSNSSRAQTLTSGGADVIDGLGAQSSQQVKGSDKADLLSIQGINIGYMAMNMAQREEFRNKKVRKAIAYAVDMKNIVNKIYKGIASQASQPITPKVLGYNEKLDPYPHDPDKAKSLLKEAGYGDGFSFELATFKNPRTYNPNPQQAASTVKSNLSDVGIDVTIKTQTFSKFLTYTASGKHDACFLGWMTDNADPDNFYYVLMDPKVDLSKVPDGQDWIPFDTKGYSTLNVMGWANTNFMKTVRDAQKKSDPKKRAELYREAAKIQHEEVPWLNIAHAKAMLGVRKEVKGMFVAPIGGPFFHLVGKKS